MTIRWTRCPRPWLTQAILDGTQPHDLALQRLCAPGSDLQGAAWAQTVEAQGFWIEDPPASSYPACLAVKAAELQSAPAGERMLRRLREAVMTERRNIARREVILAIADGLAGEEAEQFEADRFRRDLEGRAALDALREDIKECATLALAGSRR